LCIIVLIILVINIIYKRLNSHEKKIGIKLSKSNLWKKDIDKLRDEYLNTFSRFWFIFPIYTLYRCKKLGSLFGLLFYKIIVSIIIWFIYISNAYWNGLFSWKLLTILIFWIIILNIPNYIIGKRSKNMLYSTWKFRTIKEMYEHEKWKEKISIFLVFLFPFIKIFLLVLIGFAILFMLFALGWGWRN